MDLLDMSQVIIPLPPVRRCTDCGHALSRYNAYLCYSCQRQNLEERILRSIGDLSEGTRTVEKGTGRISVKPRNCRRCRAHATVDGTNYCRHCIAKNPERGRIRARSLLPKLQSTVISGERIDYSPGTTMGFEFYEHK